MKSVKNILLVFVPVFLLLNSANAASIYDSRSLWKSSTTIYTETTELGENTDTVAAGEAISIGYDVAVSFNEAMDINTIGVDWATWSGDYQGDVLFVDSFTEGLFSITGTFSNSHQLGGFGMEIEPNSFSDYDIALTLSDGTVLTQTVSGNAGAKFFGWHSDDLISSFSVSSIEDFAIGNFIAAPEGPHIPIPGSVLLLGSGLLGMLSIRRRMR